LIKLSDRTPASWEREQSALMHSVQL